MNTNQSQNDDLCRFIRAGAGGCPQSIHGSMTETENSIADQIRINRKILDPQKENAKSFGVTDKKKTLLVVDDDEEMLGLISEILADAGYRVLSANGGREAVRIYLSHKNEIALTILDMEMPDMNGKDVALRIKQSDQNAKILFCSGLLRNDLIEKLADACSLSFVQKPFENESLRVLVGNILNG